MAEAPGGGGGGGTEISVLTARIVGDASQIVQEYQKAEAAGSAASRLTRQYLQAIGTAFEDAGENGDVITQAFLDIGRAVLESGRNFGEAQRAMRQVADGGQFATDVIKRLKDAVDGLNSAEQAGIRTSAQFYGALEKRAGMDPNRRPGAAPTGAAPPTGGAPPTPPAPLTGGQVLGGPIGSRGLSSVAVPRGSTFALSDAEKEALIAASGGEEFGPPLTGGRHPATGVGLGLTEEDRAALLAEAERRERPGPARDARGRFVRAAPPEPERPAEPFRAYAERTGAYGTSVPTAGAPPTPPTPPEEPPDEHGWEPVPRNLYGDRGRQAAILQRNLDRERRVEERRLIEEARDRAAEDAQLERDRARMGPHALGAAQLTRARDEQIREQQRQMGPYEQPASAVRDFNRERERAMGPHEQDASVVREFNRRRDERMRRLTVDLWGHRSGEEGYDAATGRSRGPFDLVEDAAGGGGGGGGGGGDGPRRRGGGGNGGIDPFGFVAANSQMIRLGAGLLGISLGWNIVAGAARNFHDWVAKSAEQSERIARGAHDIQTTFGANARSMQAFAEQSAAANRQPIAQVEQGVVATGRLGREYGFTQAQEQAVAQTAGQLARVHSQPREDVGKLTEQFVDAIAAGGEVRELGVNVSDDYLRRVRGINLSQMTPEEAAQRRYTEATRQRDEFLKNQAEAGAKPGEGATAEEARNLNISATERLGRGVGDLFSGLGATVSETIGKAAIAADESQRQSSGQSPETLRANAAQAQAMAESGMRLGPITGGFGGGPRSISYIDTATGAIISQTDAQDRLARVTDRTNELIQQEVDKKNAEAKATQDAADAAANYVAPLLDIARAGRSQQLANITTTTLQRGAEAAQFGQIARGPLFTAAGDEARRANAQGEVEQSVEQERAALAARAQRTRPEGPGGPATGLRDSLQQEVELARQAEGIDSQRYRDAVDLLGVYERESRYQDQILAVEQAQSAIEQVRGAAQHDLDQVTFAQRQRELDSANAMASARVQQIQAQQALIPLQLQQSVLQHDISVASRTNLDTERDLLLVRQQSLGVSERMEDIQYGMNRNNAEARAMMARAIRGEGGVDVNRLAQLQMSQLNLSLDQAELGPAALDAEQAQRMVQRRGTREEIGRGLAGIPLTRAQRDLEDQMFVAQQNQAVAAATANYMQGQLDISVAMDQPLKTNADRAVLMADRWKAIADDTVRHANAAREASTMGVDPNSVDWQAVAAQRLGAPQGVAVTPPALPQVTPSPVMATTPDAASQVNVGVHMPGAVVNSLSDIERLSQDAAQKAYYSTRNELIAVFQTAQMPVSPALAGTTGQGRHQ